MAVVSSNWKDLSFLLLLLLLRGGNSATYRDIPDAGGNEGNRVLGAYCYTFEKQCSPDMWDGLCATGTNQSPIMLREHAAKNHDGHIPIKFESTYKNVHTVIWEANNGHSIIVQLNKNATSNAEFSHADKKLKYKFAHFHFHWGSTPAVGSEHSVDKHRYPMEMHIVHYKSIYHSVADALKYPEDNTALAVIGVFLKVGKPLEPMQFIVDYVKKKAIEDTPGVSPVQGSLKLTDLLPKNREAFRYLGSLTTPPCAENVLWTVFKNPIEVSADQAATFRKVKTANEGHRRSQNFRPLQSLNARATEFFH